MNVRWEPHAQSQALLQAQCRRLCEGPGDTGAPAALKLAFHTTLGLHRDDLLVDLFPALHESMAGSDAVCIREMQAAAAAQMDALDAAWRAACDAAASPVARRALVSVCDRLLAYERAEVLPMAERLLDDGAQARALAAMRGRRSTPSAG